MIINRAHGLGAALRTIVLCLLVLGSVLFGRQNVCAHGHDDPDLPLATVVNHYLAFYDYFADEALKELHGDSESFRQLQIEFASGKFIQNGRLLSTAKKALVRYETAVNDGSIATRFNFQDQERNFFRKVWLGFIDAIASGAEGGARYGFIFGVSYMLWELTEHMVLKGIPVGSGPLCTVFPLIWTSIIIPLSSPIHFLLDNPDRRPLSESFSMAFKGALLKRKLEKTINALVIENQFRVRKSDETKKTSSNFPVENVLRESSLWTESLLHFQANRLNLNHTLSSESFLLEFALKLRTDSKIDSFDVVRLSTLLLEPAEILTHVSEELYASKAVSFWSYLRARKDIGSLKKIAERLTRVLFRLSLQSRIYNAEGHADEVSRILEDYFQVLKVFSVETKPSNEAKISIRMVAQRVRDFARGRHFCAEKVAALSQDKAI